MDIAVGGVCAVGWHGRRRWFRGDAAALLCIGLCACVAPARGDMMKLLGGSITWEVNPEFLSGETGKRTVTFNMRTSWALGKQTGAAVQVDTCDEMQVGSTVNCNDQTLAETDESWRDSAKMGSCNHANSPDGVQKCSVAEKFGVLCVAQLVVDSNGVYRPKFRDLNHYAQCVSETNAHHSETYLLESGGYSSETDVKPATRKEQSLIEIGIPNAFTIRQIYHTAISDANDPSSNGRQPPPSSVVTGTLSHTVEIAEDVAEVVAWLAPRIEFNGNNPPDRVSNLVSSTGLLLPGCSGAGDTAPCMFNECSLQRDGLPNNIHRGAAFRANHDQFWNNWGDGTGSEPCAGKPCLREASPALETYVPLCSNVNTAKRKCSGANAEGVNNYYSPVTELPDLIEVTITPASRAQPGACDQAKSAGTPWTYNAFHPDRPAACNLLTAPHQAFRAQSFDLDGHQMTQYSPQLRSELIYGHKMGQYDYDRFVKDRMGWLYTGSNCPDGDVCCQREELQRSMRVDCVATDSDPGNGYWPDARSGTEGQACGVGCSGCRFFFDLDRDSQRREGNLIKPDFSFDIVDADSSQSLYVGKNRFTQHVLNTIDFPFNDVDNPKDAINHIANQQLGWNLGSGQAIVQNVFSMFGCDAGLQNQPPVFVRSLCDGDVSDSCTDAVNTNVKTVYECAFWDVPSNCKIDLYARDFQMNSLGVDGRHTNEGTADNVVIQYALGYDHLDPDDLEQVSTLKTGHVHFKYTFHPTEKADQDYIQTLGFIRPVENIGRVFVRCFVAYDQHKGENLLNARSCPSMPLCIKIKINGSKPEFIKPTPMEPSFDDNGILVPRRHDFPACQGYPMKLQLRVQDSLPAAIREKLRQDSDGLAYLQMLRYRIFIEDKDVDFDTSLDPNKESYRYLKKGGLMNLDFFEENIKEESLAATSERCGTFSGYGGQREGNNANQSRPDPLMGQGNAKSVMSPYQQFVEYCACTDDPCSGCPTTSNPIPAASLTVTFDADAEKRNGVSLRDEQLCNEERFVGDWANCREKLTNMDQVICALAYDNVRSITKRWVGETDPNGDDVKHWQRDHSNGDQASEMRCFRILIAAPPVFVTDPTGTTTPFSDSWRTITDTTGVRTAYKQVSMRVGQTRSFTFLAQDPNPTDDIAIFILSDPGIPPGMTVGLSDCVMRTEENSMCRADDKIDRGSYPNQDWSATFRFDATSRCSRAKRQITWTPGGDVAGQSYKVCAVARDNSNQCEGTVPEFATMRGWFGEQQCILFDVVRLLVEWGGDFANLGTSEWTVKAFVGCEFKFFLNVSDALASGDENDQPYPLKILVQDTKLSGVGTQVLNFGESMKVTWGPGRGTEGKQFYLCFAVTDGPPKTDATLDGDLSVLETPTATVCRGGIKNLEPCQTDDDCGGGVCHTGFSILDTPTDMVCRGGTEHLKGCETDRDCGGGRCQKACVMIEVQRCQYCVKGDDTLTWMMRYFGIETNWLRLWALNSYEMRSELTRDIQDARWPAAQPEWLLDDGDSAPAYVDDPDAIMTDGAVKRVYVGAVYRAAASDTLLALAARFRTTVKTLMAMNPDVDGDEQLETGDQLLCVLPCTTPG